MNEKKPRTWSYQASATHRFFLYDPEGNGFMYFATAEERDALAPSVIGEYCDDGWSEEVTQVCAGEVTAFATKTNVEKRPMRADFESDEDFEDAMEEWPNHDADETCDFELRPLAAK